MRTGIGALIDEEIDRQAEHGDGRIVIKCNAVVDPDMVEHLYRASQAGVHVDLIVRGMCSLQPGIPGVSETIRVRSIVGRFLEHSRIFCFGQGERERYYIGSADIMERNLDRRVEAAAPVRDPALQARLREIIEIMLADDRRAWVLGSDAAWRRVESLTDEPPTVDTFRALMDVTLASAVRIVS
jgi:polyphosphate kinase